RGRACRQHERDSDEDQLHWICLTPLMAATIPQRGGADSPGKKLPTRMLATMPECPRLRQAVGAGRDAFSDRQYAQHTVFQSCACSSSAAAKSREVPTLASMPS